MQIGHWRKRPAAVIDSICFPWECRLFPFLSRSLPIPNPTIDTMFVPLPWEWRLFPFPVPMINSVFVPFPWDSHSQWESHGNGGYSHFHNWLSVCPIPSVNPIPMVVRNVLYGIWQTLWGGWCVIGPRHRFYFAGDTGYNETLFRHIRSHYGPFHLAALPIGAYSPR